MHNKNILGAKISRSKCRKRCPLDETRSAACDVHKFTLYKERHDEDTREDHIDV